MDMQIHGGEVNRVREGRGMNSACSKLISASLHFNSFPRLGEYLMNPSVCISECVSLCVDVFVFCRTFSVSISAGLVFRDGD